MSPSLRSLPLILVIAVSCTSLLGCGSSSPSRKGPAAKSSTVAAASRNAADEAAAAHPSSSAGETIATVVAHTKIGKNTLLHRMAIGSPLKNEVPVPPGYSACVAHLKAKSSGEVQKPSSGSDGAASTGASPKRTCEAKYKTLQQTALSSLINEAWLVGEAAELGISVDQAALARELKASSAALASQGPNLEGRLAVSGRTVADLKQELLIGQLSNKIYERIQAKVPKVTDALISRYYAARKHAYALPTRRDLHIVRAASAAAALHAKSEIQAGKSFADVVGQLTVAQPFSARGGSVLGLTPSLYSEPYLAKKIFAAPRGVLIGPVKIPLGYYVFEVTRVIPPHQLTLAEATPAIKRQLPEVLLNKTRLGFIAAYKRKWTSRTSCEPGYVVLGCERYRAPKGGTPEDAYLL